MYVWTLDCRVTRCNVFKVAEISFCAIDNGCCLNKGDPANSSNYYSLTATMPTDEYIIICVTDHLFDAIIRNEFSDKFKVSKEKFNKYRAHFCSVRDLYETYGRVQIRGDGDRAIMERTLTFLLEMRPNTAYPSETSCLREGVDSARKGEVCSRKRIKN